ncbi:MAG: thiamine-phosphate kinase [Cytophagales bacterium]
MKRTEINELGEFGLIDLINSKNKTTQKSTVKSIGDDAAVIDNGGNDLILISTDSLIEGIHFDLSFSPLAHLGYKSVSVNVSDIAAMNGTPSQIVVSLSMSNRFSVEAVEELYKGIFAACEDYNIDLVGGDTTASLSGLFINVSVIGFVDRNKVSYRCNAKPNDIICVTGDLGAAFLGLKVLQREKEVFLSTQNQQPELEGFEYCIRRQLKPSARVDIIHDLAEQQIIPSSMIDVSDGLASELFHICKQSGVGAVILEENVPLDQSVYENLVAFNIQPMSAAFNGGEDYELLFTISQEEYQKIEKHPDIHAIGLIKNKEDGIFLLSKQGNKYPLEAQGWKHF